MASISKKYQVILEPSPLAIQKTKNCPAPPPPVSSNIATEDPCKKTAKTISFAWPAAHYSTLQGNLPGHLWRMFVPYGFHGEEDASGRGTLGGRGLPVTAGGRLDGSRGEEELQQPMLAGRACTALRQQDGQAVEPQKATEKNEEKKLSVLFIFFGVSGCKKRKCQRNDVSAIWGTQHNPDSKIMQSTNKKINKPPKI